MTPSLLDRWSRGWRGPLMAALVALAATLPGALRLPATDRTEARLAEASAQMVEDRDFAAAASTPGEGAARRRLLGVHWLQAASVAAVSQAEARQIWAFRLPALAAVAVAAAACAWGGAALFGPSGGLAAGAILGASALLSTAGTIDAPGALLSAGVTLAVAALVRLRLASEGGLQAGAPTAGLFWLGLALSTAAGGLAGPAIVILTGATIWAVERRAPWLRSLGWGWGLILLAALVGPTLVAEAIEGERAPLSWLLYARGERTPGLQLLLSPLALSPFAFLLPAALAAARRGRRDVSVRLALCWLIPAWTLLEFTRGQSPARGLMVYGGLAWLCAVAVRDGIGPRAAQLGAALQVLAAAVLAAGIVYAAQRFGGGAALAWAAVTAALVALAGLVAATLTLRRRAPAALLAATALGVVAHGAAMAGLGPALDRLWLAKRAAAALAMTGLDPRGGVTPGPVAAAGFSEPSLAFALGGQVEDASPEEAAAAILTGRPAIVEARQQAAFLQALPSRRAVRRVAEVEGYDYAAGAALKLEVYGPASNDR